MNILGLISQLIGIKTLRLTRLKVVFSTFHLCHQNKNTKITFYFISFLIYSFGRSRWKIEKSIFNLGHARDLNFPYIFRVLTTYYYYSTLVSLQIKLEKVDIVPHNYDWDPLNCWIPSLLGHGNLFIMIWDPITINTNFPNKSLFGDSHYIFSVGLEV